MKANCWCWFCNTLKTKDTLNSFTVWNNKRAVHIYIYSCKDVKGCHKRKEEMKKAEQALSKTTSRYYTIVLVKKGFKHA